MGRCLNHYWYHAMRGDLVLFSIAWLMLNVISAIVLACRYYASNLVAGIIITAYLGWLMFALYLNIGIAVLN